MVGEFFMCCLQSCLYPWHSLETTSSATPRYVTLANKLTFLSLFPHLENSFPSRAVMWAERDHGCEAVQEFVVITVEGPDYRRLLWSWSFKSSLTQKDDLGQADCFKWSSFSFHPDPRRKMERWLSPWRNKSLIPMPDAGPGSKAVVPKFQPASESPGSLLKTSLMPAVHPQNFWCSSAGVGPKYFHIYQVSRYCCCCPGHHTLRIPEWKELQTWHSALLLM